MKDGYARLTAEIFGVSQSELEECLDSFSPTEKLCIQLSFGLTDDGRRTPPNQIAEQLGVAKGRIRPIKEGVLRRLRRDDRRSTYSIFPTMIIATASSASEPNFGPLDLPVRTVHVLHRAGITEISQLTALTRHELSSIDHMALMDYQKILDAVRAVPEFQNCTLMTSAS